jgi:precorrin-3B C17-methyltransferase
MTPGRVDIVGLGPGPAEWMTFETQSILQSASDIVGYGGYLDRVPDLPGQRRHASDNREELQRARVALDLALSGAKVAVVSGGDPGVFAMASAVFEAVEEGDARWRSLQIETHPGVSAVLAAAARLGAPLGHDFVVLSLSDNRKPWGVIERRVRAAAEGDFVMAFYNPASKARPRLIVDAFALLRTLRPAETIAAFAHAIGRKGERVSLTTLGEADPSEADMSTLVLIGSSETRRVERSSGGCWIYTPRTYGRGR